MKTIQKISIILITCLCFYKGYAQKSDTAILYKHAAPASFKSVIVRAVFRLMGKNSLKEEVRSKKFDTSYAASIPKKYLDEILIDTQIVANRNALTLTPKKKPSLTKVLYIHGGTFLHNISKPHWNLIIALMRRTYATFIVPDYPLAPFQTAVDAFRMIEEVYKHLLSITDADNILLMGDSAGGGLALSFVQKLKKEDLPQPQHLIMISPWLDITNPDVDKELLKKDPMLEPDGARVAGKMWAGKLDTKNYLVSPIYGDFSGLCPISIFIGGHDILLGDARKLQSLLKQKHIPLNYFEYPKMFHVWVAATFLKEAKVVIGQISELILKKPDQD